MVYAALICRTLVGLVFAVSAFSKLRNGTAYREFASWLASVPVPLARNRPCPRFSPEPRPPSWYWWRSRPRRWLGWCWPCSPWPP